MRQQIAKGSDIPLDITLTGSDGTAIAPSGLLEIFVIVYARVSGKVLAKFQSAEVTGWGPVGIVDDAAGEIRVTIDSASTKVADAGDYVMDIKLKFEDDSVEDNEFDVIMPGVECFELIESRLKDA